MAADVEIETDRSVGLAIDASDVVADPSVTVFPAIGLIAKTLFVSCADAVVVVEKWASVAALQAHSQAPHMADYRVRVKDFVKGVKLLVTRPVE